MSGFFYNLGRKFGPRVRRARWAWAAATAPEAERIEAERLVGAEMAAAVRRQTPPCPDPAAQEYLDRIGADLHKWLTNPHRRFTFEGIGGESPQAFCLPGGFVFVSLPMVRLCREDHSRLAFVLAHEMAHIVKGHVMERILANALIGKAAGWAAVSPAARQAVRRLGVEFLRKAYSREHENEADAFGLRLMTAAGFDPAGAMRLLEALDAARDKETFALDEWLSTHPDIRTRIARLKTLIEEQESR